MDRTDVSATPVQAGLGNGPGSEPPPAERLHLSRSFRRACSHVKEEAQDFCLLSEDSQNKLKERRHVVLSKRYQLKPLPAPSDQTDSRAAAAMTFPTATKPPVVKLTIEGIKKLHKKTRSVINRDSATEKQAELAMFLPQSEQQRMKLFREPAALHVPAQVTVQAKETQEPETAVLLSNLGNLLDLPTGDEADTVRPHSKGKNWLWCRGTAPEDLKKRKRQYSMTERIKKYIRIEEANVIEYRPIFTYYVTVAQLLILILSLSIYGFGPWGFTKERRANLVMVTSLTLENVDVEEPQNVWLGNREADLIHLGARFTPCMRDDPGIRAEIARDVDRERGTACCVRHDRSGCVQTQKDQCSSSLEGSLPSLSSASELSGLLPPNTSNRRKVRGD